jgi:hypothetical protein
MDLRLPIGLVFTIYGIILSVYGVQTNGAAMYSKSLGINVNTSWGVVLLVFGGVMLLFAMRGRKA